MSLSNNWFSSEPYRCKNSEIFWMRKYTRGLKRNLPWYNGITEEAARFYAKTFPDSAVTALAIMFVLTCPL